MEADDSSARSSFRERKRAKSARLTHLADAHLAEILSCRRKLPAAIREKGSME